METVLSREEFKAYKFLKVLNELSPMGTRVGKTIDPEDEKEPMRRSEYSGLYYRIDKDAYIDCIEIAEREIKDLNPIFVYILKNIEPYLKDIAPLIYQENVKALEIEAREYSREESRWREINEAYQRKKEKRKILMEQLCDLYPLEVIETAINNPLEDMIWKRKWVKPSETLYWNENTKSWKRKKYVLAEDENKKMHCSCKGFVMNGGRKECKHLKEFRHNPNSFQEIDIDITGSIIELAEAIADEIDKSDAELKIANNSKIFAIWDIPTSEGAMSKRDLERVKRRVRLGPNYPYLEDRHVIPSTEKENVSILREFLP